MEQMKAEDEKGKREEQETQKWGNFSKSCEGHLNQGAKLPKDPYEVKQFQESLRIY